MTDPTGVGRFYSTHFSEVSHALSAVLAAHAGAETPRIVTETIAYSQGLSALVMIGHIAPERAYELSDEFLARICAETETDYDTGAEIP